MKYQVRTEDLWCHREDLDNPVLSMVDFKHEYPKIDGVEVIIVEVKDGWLITPACFPDDDTFTDIGPYPSLDEAIIHVRLRMA